MTDVKKFFFVVTSVVAGAVLGLAIISTVVFIREKNINNKLYIS